MFETPAPTKTLRLLYGAFVFLLGAQSIRFFFGSLTWYLRDTLGMGVVELIPLALAPVALGALLPVLSRHLTIRGGLWLGTWALVIARCINQVSAEPSIDLWASALASAALVGLLPLLLSMGRSALVGGLVLGIALDTAIKGLGLSLDLAYRPGWGPTLGVLGLSVVTVGLLVVSPPVERRGVAARSGALLMGIGPFLFIEYLILQNQGWVSEVTGVGGAQTQLRIALLNVVALIALAWFARVRLVVLFGVLLVVSCGLAAESSGLVVNLLALAAVPAAAPLWSSLVPDPDERGVGFSGVYLTAGMALYVGLGILYYVPLDLDLGYTQTQARLVAVGLMAIFGFLGLFSAPVVRSGSTRQAWAFAALASLLPLIGFLGSGSGSAHIAETTGAIRVMTYNIHSAYDVSGRHDIEAIARVIEEASPDVVGLQEVPRGRLISGLTDELTILQVRLGYEYSAFFGTTDPTWGNAVLSRFPITEIVSEYLPTMGTPMRRGLLGATIVVGTTPVLFVSTHLQHVNDPRAHDRDPELDLYPVHRQQIRQILEEWQGREPAILVGDFNARPGWAQIELVLDAGWVDAWAEVGTGDGPTSGSIEPAYRVDYIFHTPDVTAQRAMVGTGMASDHLAVTADLTLP